MFVRKLFISVVCSLLLFFGMKVNIVNAETSPYRSAGWIASDGNTAYTNLSGCQASGDEQYCSRAGSSGYAGLFFGSFGQLEDFGIPINSKIDKIHLRIKGKNSISQQVGITNAYNKIPFSTSCLSSPTTFTFFLGPVDNSIELHNTLSDTKLANCITSNNINFRNLTFNIVKNSTANWSADIDNFEIAFDYTPPDANIPPVVFPDGQKGIVWEMGPDKSNLTHKTELEGVISVATGEYFGAALKSDGTVWTWTNTDKTPKQVKGENGVGLLTNVKKITAGNNFGMALKEDGTLWEWSQGLEEPMNPTSPDITDIVDIAGGRGHKLALRSDGTVYAWGLNNNGQIGIGCMGGNCSVVNSPRLISNFKDVIGVAAGEFYSLAVKSDGTVWGWGSSRSWRLGESVLNINNGFPERTSPVRIPELSNIKTVSTRGVYSLVITGDGKIFEWGGEYRLRIPREVVGISNPSSISAGGWSSFSFGVLGHAIKEDGTLWQLYINDIPPKQVPHLKDVIAVASGDQTPTLAVINSSGEVLGDSTIKPFLDLPWNYGEGNFEKQVFNPESWFDHMYPLQNIACCTNKVRTYIGDKDKDVAYRSHAGYDYASRNDVEYRTPVLAAASGSAEFKPASKTGGLGNTIKIDHGNGYQTWYGHLDPLGLVISTEGTTQAVEKGQKIGETGFTGNIFPPNQFGAHIHFAVMKDMNNNGNFNDDYPYGLVDPLGWDGDYKDPWTEYGGETKGADSVKLFTNFPKPKQQAISKSVGGELNHKSVQVKFDSDTLPLDFTVHYKDGAFEDYVIDHRKYHSVSPSFFLEVFNSLGDKITSFFKPVKIIYNYSDADISNTKEETLRLHYYDIIEQKWIPVDSVQDLDKKIIIADLEHFTQFAVMGERKDATAPITEAVLNGEKGESNWFRSSIDISLIAKDEEGGFGVDKTLYAMNDKEWLDYFTPFTLISEGSHEVAFQSSDKENNIEEIKKIQFQIDKTSPTTTASTSGTVGLEKWYTSDVKVEFNVDDNASGIAKTEYSLDDGETYQNYTSEISIGKEGESEILYRSHDKAGNIEEVKKLIIKIDKTAPSSLVYTTGLRGKENWYRSNVQIAFNGVDDVSGYKSSYYSLDNGGNYEEYIDPVVLETEGDFTISYYTVDNAGNKKEAKTTYIRIDKTDPVVTISANPSLLLPVNGKMVNVKITGNVDEKNPLSKSFNVIDEYGSVEPTFTDFNQTIKLEAKRNGSDKEGRLYLIKVTAADMAGNTSIGEAKVLVPHDQRN